MLAGPIEGAVAMLGELREAGHELHALTNWSAETFPIARERYAFLDWFESILVSGEVGLIKPDPAHLPSCCSSASARRRPSASTSTTTRRTSRPPLRSASMRSRSRASEPLRALARRGLAGDGQAEVRRLAALARLERCSA